MEELSPRAKAKRRQITDAARTLFLAQGFSRTTMDAITAEAGVSKQTLYAYFPSKIDLLIAILAEVEGTLPDPPELVAPTTRAELRTALLVFAESVTGTLLQSQMIAVLRLVVGEAVRLPEVRSMLVEALPIALLNRTAALLRAAAGNGVLTLDHPEISVRLFVGGVMSYVMFGGLLSNEPPVRPKPESLQWLVDAYLRTLDFTDDR
ncbi:TetR/AcrR family transcriptional regulator [Micropruina sp.]|uniref:TetR/AcrR family transcriptional regulator n=1 Tax=Micropruina sp. TaxID=2737536 RepID=UPI0039E2969F